LLGRRLWGRQADALAEKIRKQCAFEPAGLIEEERRCVYTGVTFSSTVQHKCCNEIVLPAKVVAVPFA